ncbi:hypothetical protein [Gordonia sihwensis]|uniref:hypothetical protein n=1 Tax=Gordonia sihwensis TaxID=173559 RepID=UPI0005F0BC20|nr:hypothetical protein [Gordonia sihwensis]KJR10513.1 hypothetical protein UG54_00510 [Gordonia sihwensis]
MTTQPAVRRHRRRAPRPITIGIAGYDGSAISWSREDETDDLGHGHFAGTPQLVDTATAILAVREPVMLPTGSRWVFPHQLQLRVVDVAAAMFAALQVDADLTELVERFPELAR